MDDVAETFLMRLKRASGADGLSGLKPVSIVGDIVFIRPLLNLRGGELRTFLKSRGIAWREDSTNSDVAILRNKVRHVILPFLERELDPKIVEHICRSAGYLREVSSGIVRKVEPPKEKPERSCEPEEPSAGGYSLEVSDAVGYEVSPVEIGKLPACAWFDAETLKGHTLEVRRWRDGDWMRPCGFPHRKKLQDIFVTAKTPPSVRRTLPVVADAETGEVLWIPGYRVSESVKVPSMSAPSVKLRLIFDTFDS
jgi:tRNA(Ile)-lysidine synthetase-like protein